MALLLTVAALFVAYVNGANDNFKGVATLLGSRTATYRQALSWGTLATVAGAVSAAILAGGLAVRFSGKGLVPDEVCASPVFLVAVAFGAAVTVLLATLLGFPISTTHSLLGAMSGAGLVMAGSRVELSVLIKLFFLPLVLSPLVAVVGGSIAYLVFHSARQRLGITRGSCVCIGETMQCLTSPLPAANVAMAASPVLTVAVGTDDFCLERYGGKVVGLHAAPLLKVLHYASAGIVSFARGMNDAPKIVGLLTPLSLFSALGYFSLVGLVMACGGIFNARKVALTLSERITPMNEGQGFTANLITAILVIMASCFALPVSTTHVACGSLFGIGLVTGQANKRMIGEILLSWLFTLPVAAIAGALGAWMMR